MKLKELIEKLNLEVRSGSDKLDNEIKSGYVSDLLSDCLAHAKEGDIWITLQTHQNIIAVASLKNISAILLINGREPEDDTLKKAKEMDVPILASKLPAFEVVGRLYNFGISGMR